MPTGGLGRVWKMSGLKPKVVAMNRKPRQKAKKGTTRKRTVKRGSEKMRDAADKAMARDSKKLAKALSESGQKGQLSSIKFMYELSEAGAEDHADEGARKIRDLALELANAPQWTGPLPSETEDDSEEGLVG
jgi:hypothetical protein